MLALTFRAGEMLDPIKIIGRERLQNVRFSVRIVRSGEHKTVTFVTPFSAAAKNLS